MKKLKRKKLVQEKNEYWQKEKSPNTNIDTSIFLYFKDG